MQKLSGKRVVVTGASSGIGEATALALAEEGASLVLGARRVDRLNKLADKLRAIPGVGEVVPLALDVTDRESSQRFVQAALEKGPADMLVNSAGLARGIDHLVDASEDVWREMLETNVFGLLRMTKAFLPGMIRKKGGLVVNIGSVAALEPYAGGTVYGGSKAAVKVIGKALRHELLGTGVRVCTVEAGAVETEFSEVRFSGDRARAKSTYRGITPLTGADVADVIRFVATRPPHVVLEDIVLYPVQQASTTAFHRET